MSWRAVARTPGTHERVVATGPVLMVAGVITLALLRLGWVG